MVLHKRSTLRFAERFLREKFFHIYVSLSGFIKKAHKDSKLCVSVKQSHHCLLHKKLPDPSRLFSHSPTLVLSLTICGSDWISLSFAARALPDLILYVAVHSLSGCCVNSAGPWCGGSGVREQGPRVMESPGSWEQWPFRMWGQWCTDP